MVGQEKVSSLSITLTLLIIYPVNQIDLSPNIRQLAWWGRGLSFVLSVRLLHHLRSCLYLFFLELVFVHESVFVGVSAYACINVLCFYL